MLARRAILASPALPHLVVVGLDAVGRGDYTADSPDAVLQALIENPWWPILHVIVAVMVVATAIKDTPIPLNPGGWYRASASASAGVMVMYGLGLLAWGLSIPSGPSILGPALCVAAAVTPVLLSYDRRTTAESDR